MMNNRVGYRFSPTNEELINFYLKNKILGVVDDSITEVDIYSYDPNLLPSLSKIKSNDLVWYFFSRNESTYTKYRTVRKRTTPSGFWKLTGRDRPIKDKGENGSEIGIVKTLVYHEGRSLHRVKTCWVMHEYHITCLPPSQQSTYVLCKIMYKGEDGDMHKGEGGDILSSVNEGGDIQSGGNAVRNLPSGASEVENFSSGVDSIRARAVTEMDKRQQNLPSVQRPVFDSNAFRAATFAKMYKLLQNLPSTEIKGKLNSHAAP